MTANAAHNRHIAVIVAAGRGTRMKADRPKILLDLAGEPVLVRTVRVFEKCEWIDGIVIVAAPEYVDEVGDMLRGFSKVAAVTAGGQTRTDSVMNGLREAGKLRDTAGREESMYVYIHDGARPFVTQDILERVRAGAEECDACVCGMPVKDTIRQVGTEELREKAGSGAEERNAELLTGTPERSSLRLVQTPQAFEYELVMSAYEAYADKTAAGGEDADRPVFTDDASLVEIMTGRPVYMVTGSYRNIKLTTPEDMVIGEALAKEQSDG